ncbi:MAG: transposase [Planctomycetota bacterium]
MPQSLAQVLVHIVFSTKNRKRFLSDADLRARLYAYMAVVLRDDVDSPAVIINGTDDHVHVLVSLSRKFAIMDVVKVMKTETTKWLKKEGVRDFAWQSGYGVFSVSQSMRDAVVDYICNQEERHKRTTFQEEFRE